jgi:PHD/YefM family antitoxin component YafN of YafNO toxin-antitoxin module
METKGSLPRLKKTATCHYSERCYVTAAWNGVGGGGSSVLKTVRTKSDITSHNMESQVVINISEYRAVAMYSELELQLRVFPKLLKHLTKLQYAITQKA